LAQGLDGCGPLARRARGALRLRERLYILVERLPRRVGDVIADREMRVRMRVGRPVKLVPEEQFTRTCEDALRLLAQRRGAEDLGDYLEFGVYAGTSMRCMLQATRNTGLEGVRLFGFDSFVGLPAVAAEDDDGYWMPGMFRSDVERVRAMLARAGMAPGRGELVEGWFDYTLTPETRDPDRLGIRRASVLMMDADLYTSTKAAFEFCLPVIGQEAVVVFDDWWPELVEKDMAEKRALDEFLAEHPVFAVEELDMSYKPESKVFLLQRR
jgi:O-methyltransferase